MSKVSWEDIFLGIQWTVFENKCTLWKRPALHTTTQMHCKARQVFRNVFSTNQGNDSDMTFVAGATKFNLKNLKTWSHQLHSNGRFEPLTSSSRSLTWAYKLKALKSSSHSNFTWLRWWCWSSLSLSCVRILMQRVWFAEF